MSIQQAIPGGMKETQYPPPDARFFDTEEEAENAAHEYGEQIIRRDYVT